MALAYEGPWGLYPKEIELPRVTLTPEQEQENELAREQHQRTCTRIDALISEAESLGAQISVEEYDDEYRDDEDYPSIQYPKLVLPHNPEAFDFSKFTTRHWAYANYLDMAEHRGLTELERIGRSLVAVGIPLQWQMRGLVSMGRLDDKMIPPPLPEWARVPSSTK